MKKSSALMIAGVLVISGCCSNVGSSGTRTVFTTIPDTSDDPEPAGTTVTGAFDLPEWDISFLLDLTDDHPDKLYRNDEYDAELLVFRTGDTYFTYSTERKMAGWTRTYSEVPAEMEMLEGCFELISADITRYTGGEAGYMGNPHIKTIKSIRSMTQTEAAAYCEMEQYKPGDTLYNEPRCFGEYILINVFGGKVCVYREGKLCGGYDTEIQAEAAIGLRKIPDISVKMERLGNYNAYVFRCGDSYLTYCPHIGMNPCWTEYINPDFGSEPQEFSLNDGEGVYLKHAEVMKLNGGNARYVNTPMIISAGDIEQVDYSFIARCMEPFWAEKRAQSSPGTTSPEWSEFSDGYNAMFDRTTAGTWLIYQIDDKYLVYLDDYTEKRQTAECGTVYEAAKFISEYR